MIDYDEFDQILRVQFQNEWNQFFLLLAIGIALIVVTHFGSKYSYQQNRRRIKLVYKLLICAAALSIVELPSIFHLKYDMDHDNYICTSARYNWEMKSARYLHHLIIYPDDQELGIELVVPSLDTNADNIDRELFPKTDQHGTVWYSGKSKYVLYFEPDNTMDRSSFNFVLAPLLTDMFHFDALQTTNLPILH